MGQSLQFFLLCVWLATPVAAQVQLPEWNAAEPIHISAQAGNRWQTGSYEVWVLRGDCVIQQGEGCAKSQEAVLWIDRASATERQPHKVIAYLEGNAKITLNSEPSAPRLRDQTWFGRFYSNAGLEVRALTTAGKPDVLPPVYWRGMERRSPEKTERRSPESVRNGWRSRVQQAQFTAPAPEMVPVPAPSPMLPAGVPEVPGSARRIRVFPRSDVPVQAQWFPDPNSNQWIAVIDSGVNVLVDGMDDVGTIDVSTDRLVIWTTGTQEPDLTGQTRQDERVPLEFYMEGNIIFRQGERVIYAGKMYYDVPNEVGTVLDADVLTPVPSYDGLLRLHADVVQQTAKDRFFAQNAFLTSSRMGEPGYRLQAGDIYFQDIQLPVVNPMTGSPVVDPITGRPVIDHQRQATSSNNFLYLGPLPVFYWPVMSTDLNEPTYYIRRAQLKQDKVYGMQVLTNWSGYELLGIRNKPVGTDFDISLDYMGKRGLGHGGAFTYNQEGLFGIPGHVAGLADYWGIQDHGLDDLGRDRMNLVPEKSYRYRLFWQHRQLLPLDLQLSMEAGWISDRNFLEEYFKSEWEQLKDESTGLELKHLIKNRAWSITADYRINNFFTQTNWLPRADHFWVGQSLLHDSFTWYEHSNVGYAQFRKLEPPTNPNDQPFSYLPWEAHSREGERFATRQEIDWPFQLGVVKVVPYAMGELAHWGEDINGQPLDRVWGQAGVRASMPMWSVDPTFHSDMLNVHGVAHKIVFDMEFSAADANHDLSELPLYDPLDDDSVEAFRRHFVTSTFGWPSTIPPTVAHIPQRFDERYYALRTGLQSWVTSPSTEIADDLMAVRLGARQRWQTKRGPPSNRRIIDWVTLDTNMTFYPDPDRDNYGDAVGLVDYDFRWHVGDRLTLLTDGIFDFFDQGQQLITIGGFLSRPPRGSLYAGLRILEGPIHHKILSFSYTYWMSPKWVSSFGTSIDLNGQGNIGQNFSITRVGESLLISAGFTVDAARESVGVALAVEPRFLPKNRLGNISGAQIPPAGAFGLE